MHMSASPYLVQPAAWTGSIASVSADATVGSSGRQCSAPRCDLPDTGSTLDRGAVRTFSPSTAAALPNRFKLAGV